MAQKPSPPNRPSGADLLLLTAADHLRQGRLSEADSACMAVLETAPNHVGALHLLAMIAHQANQSERAVGLLVKAVAIEPRTAGLHLDLGVMCQQSGRIDEAIQAYTNSIDLGANNADAYFNLGTAHGSLGQGKEAIAAYGRAIEIDPGYARAYRNKATLHLAADDPETALPLSERASELLPDDPQSIADCGRALMKLERGAEAVAAFTRAVELVPSAPRMHIHVGYAHLVDGKPAAALDAIEKGLNLSPGDTLGLALKVLALVENGDRELAAPLLDFENLVMSKQFGAPAGYGSLDEFNQALVDHITSHPSLRYSESNRSVVASQGTGDLLVDPKGPFKAFEHMIRTAVEEYIDTVCHGIDHPSLTHPPARWRPSVWATVMDAHGQQFSHFHPPGWLSGVYYPNLPSLMSEDDPERAGWIEFGPPYPRIPLKAEFDVTAYRPKEGLMFLFPSYVCHQTIPFVSDEKRVSIAFDIQPLKEAP